MIRAVMVTYQDWPLIQQAIESVYPLVEEIVAIDGAYSDFPLINGSEYSTDGTREFLQSVDKVEVLIDGAGLTEPEKRNLYLVGKPGDWYFHLDADEVWEGPLEIPDADMGVCQLIQLRSGHADGRRIRLFRHVPGLHYEGKHYILKDGEGRTFSLLDKPGNAYTAAPISGRIIHHDGDRPQERHRAKKIYYRTLVKCENAIREVK